MLLDTLRTPMGKTARPSVGGKAPVGAPEAFPGVQGGMPLRPGLRERRRIKGRWAALVIQTYVSRNG